MKKTELLTLYANTQRCAEEIGLYYSSDDTPGITRIKHGKGWAFKDEKGNLISDSEAKQRLLSLAIPPAWQSVWICPSSEGHILATGIDDKGRKQYIYHPNWRRMRDTLNFYKLLSFGEYLPRIRRVIKRELRREPALDQPQVLSLMLWFLDNGYVRIGNETYFEENETVGLATLSREHIRLRGDSVLLSFVGKSHQEHTIELKHPAAARLLRNLLKRPGDRIFVTDDGQPYTAEDCNAYLHEIADSSVSAKNFRTWGGTLAAFEYLKDDQNSDQKPEKAVVSAVDQAADTLGNTRAVAKSHYVHPQILQAYVDDDFNALFTASTPHTAKELTKSEREMLGFLELLFEREFRNTQNKKPSPAR